MCGLVERRHTEVVVAEGTFICFESERDYARFRVIINN